MNPLSDTDEGKARPSVWPLYVPVAVIGFVLLLGGLLVLPELDAQDQYAMVSSVLGGLVVWLLATRWRLFFPLKPSCPSKFRSRAASCATAVSFIVAVISALVLLYPVMIWLSVAATEAIHKGTYVGAEQGWITFRGNCDLGAAGSAIAVVCGLLGVFLYGRPQRSGWQLTLFSLRIVGIAAGLILWVLSGMLHRWWLTVDLTAYATW